MSTGTSFRTKIFLCMLLAILTGLSLPLIYARVYLNDELLEQASQQILREAQLAARLMDEHTKPSQLEDVIFGMHNPDLRVSLLNSQGQVLADSTKKAADLTNMDNHADRPEFQDAQAKGQGISVRYSNTLKFPTIYAAVRLENNHVLRLAVPFASIKARMDSQISRLTLVALAAVFLALLLALFLSSRLEHSLSHMVRVVEAISLGKYQRRLRTVPGCEFTALAEAVNRMAENIAHHVTTVADQKGQLLSILETMDDGVLVLDPKGRIRTCNRALAELFPAIHDALGLPVVEAIPAPALQNAVESLLRGAPEESDDADPSDAPNNPKPLSPHSCSLQLDFPFGLVLAVHLARPSSPTPMLGAVAVFHDISAMVRLEQIRRDFVTNVSHELRTPLTAIQGYAETLVNMLQPADTSSPKSTDDCRRFAEIIHKNGLYLGRMVEELLSLARLENEDTAFPVQGTDMAEAVHGATALCQNALDARALKVESHLPEPCMVLGNPGLLMQVVRNLLENASRYAPEGSAIVVRAHLSPPCVRMSVSDSGPGIPPQDLERIFERFYRVDKQRVTASTGLGLALCKHIIDRHKGRIWAESPSSHKADASASTTFYFTLPLAPKATQDAPQEKENNI